MAQPPHYSYNPPPNEMPLYDALFAAADKQSAGYITGHAAVEFLSLSKLPVDLLKTIWTMADSPPNNMLDKTKFIVAVRLIQLFQNGKRPMDQELRLGQGEMVRPPFFEGIALPPPQQDAVATPQRPQQPHVPNNNAMPSPSPQLSPLRPAQPPVQLPPSSSLALTTQDPYAMTPAEQSRYASLFPSYAQDNYVYGPAAVDLFSKSGMDRSHLKTIWSMCDVPVDNKLDLMEFCVAMHLIVCVTRKGLGMPEELPGSLRGFVGGTDQGQAQGQMGQSQPQVIGQLGQMGGQMMQQPGQMGGQMMQQHGQMGGPPQQHQQQLQSMAPSPGSLDGIPSPDKMGTYNLGPQQVQGLPPPPLAQGGMQYGMQQQPNSMLQQQHMNATGQGAMPYQQNQMEGQGEPTTVQAGHASVGGENLGDAFAGLRNSPVDDVDEYISVGGTMSGVGGGMMSMQQASTQPPTQQHIPQPAPTPSMAVRSQNTFAPASPKLVSKAQYSSAQPQITSPTIKPRSYAYGSPKPTRKDQQVDEEFNSELEKLRSAHQKLQAEVISLRARANLVSDEEAETQLEIRQLASEIAELSIELSGLKDQMAASKAKLADSLVLLKAQKEKKESLEVAIKDTREIKDSLVAATEAVIEANEAMMKEHAHTIATTAKAAEVKVPSIEVDDMFSWDVAPVPMPTVTQMQTHSRGMSDISGHYPGTESSAQVNKALSDNMPHSFGHNWGADESSTQVKSVTADINYNAESKKTDDSQSAHSAHTSHTANTGFQSAAHAANTGIPSGGANSAFFSMEAVPTRAMVPAPVSTMGGYDYGMDFMGMGAMTPMGAPIPDAHPAAFNNPAPAPAPLPAPKSPISPSVAEVESMKKEALKAEKSFRESMDLVSTLSAQVENLEMVAKKAEENLLALEKKKGSFTAKNKKKKEVAAAQEHANAERQKANAARQKLTAAKKESESVRKLADELRQKSEQAELEAATAASMQPATANSLSNGYDHYASNTDTYGGFGLMGGQDQGGYNNPFAMG